MARRLPRWLWLVGVLLILLVGWMLARPDGPLPEDVPSDARTTPRDLTAPILESGGSPRRAPETERAIPADDAVPAKGPEYSFRIGDHRVTGIEGAVRTALGNRGVVLKLP